MADVWTAAAQGQIGRIIELLTSDDPPVPEQLDGAGRTAAFYAQLNSHDGVARILQQRGWRMMEESELFDGPGGRRGFWTERDPPARRGSQAPTPTESRAPRDAERAKSARRTSIKKSKVEARRQMRDALYRNGGVGLKDHRWYRRRQ